MSESSELLARVKAASGHCGSPRSGGQIAGVRHPTSHRREKEHFYLLPVELLTPPSAGPLGRVRSGIIHGAHGPSLSALFAAPSRDRQCSIRTVKATLTVPARSFTVFRPSDWPKPGADSKCRAPIGRAPPQSPRQMRGRKPMGIACRHLRLLSAALQAAEAPRTTLRRCQSLPQRAAGRALRNRR